MELTMAAQEDSTPWAIPSTLNSSNDEVSSVSTSPSPSASMCITPRPTISGTILDVSILYGRSFFSELGAVRRKPSRPDAPPTLSKSCSDKLALKQCTSLLSSTTSLLISPSNLYLSSLVLPASQYSETACTRAFSSNGRMKEMKNRKWDGGYRFHEFDIKTTSKEFRYNRRQALLAGRSWSQATSPPLGSLTPRLRQENWRQ